MPQSDTTLITVRGNDLPGITAKLTGVIADCECAKIIDIEQTVVHGKLLLSILVKFKGGKSVIPGNDRSKNELLTGLSLVAKQLRVHLDFESFNGDMKVETAHFEYAITCIAEEIGAKQLSAISANLAKHGINIDKIARLSHGTLRCVEMIAHSVKAKDSKKISKSLLTLSKEIGVDIAIQPHDLMRGAKRLVVMDMDSTLIQNEVIDELGKISGKGKEISAITERAMNGELSFRAALKERVRLIAGLTVKDLDKVYKKITLTEGAENLVRTLKKLGYKTAVISGGFTYFSDRLKRRLGLDYSFANELEIIAGRVTGRIKGRIVDGGMKDSLLQKIAKTEKIGLDQTIAIGDGANDIAMLSRAGLGVAFRAKEMVRRKSACSISRHKCIDSILYLLGIREKDVLRLNS